MNKFPFLKLNHAIQLLRITVAVMFLTHAVVRIANGSITQFASFLTGKQIPFSLVIVWLLTAYEIVGSILLALGYCTKWLAAGFIIILITGIVLIHASLGWFVGEHGTGGMEYSIILIAALIVIAAADKK